MATLEYIRSRPFALIGAFLGVAVVLLFFRGEATRNQQTDLKDRIVRIEASSPCVKLTTRECAIKLLNSLSARDRKRFLRKELRAAIRREVRRVQRIQIRRLREAAGSNAPVFFPPATRREPTPGSSPEDGDGGSDDDTDPVGTGSGGGPPPTPSAPVTIDVPAVTVPKLETPAGAVGPVVVDPPPVEIPCIPTPLTDCGQ